MTRSIDELLRTLSQQPAHHGLSQLEPAVWQRLDEEARPLSLGGLFNPVRVATVSAALSLGVVLGGAQALTANAAANEVSVFSAQPDLAPSTLLEGRE
jgi:hypothetical protein